MQRELFSTTSLWQQTETLSDLDSLHVVGRVKSHPTVLASLAPALLVLILQLLELLTSLECQLVRFSCLVVVEGADRQAGLAVICQNVLSVVPLLGLVVKWIRFLRAVAETSNV